MEKQPITIWDFYTSPLAVAIIEKAMKDKQKKRKKNDKKNKRKAK